MSQTTSSASPGGGINTFLIADIRGYTRYTLEHGDEAAAALTARFAAIAREEVEAADGRLLELRGDGVLAVFASARHALQGGVELQYRLARESAVNPGLAIEVGVGLDAGEAVQVEGGYRGAALNLAARLCSVAGAGEVLASEGVIHLAQKVPGLAYVPRGEMELKGFADRIRVISGQPEPDGVTGTILTDADHVAHVVTTLVKHPRLHFQLFIQVWPDPQVSVQFGTASIVWHQGQPSLDAVTDSE